MKSFLFLTLSLFISNALAFCPGAERPCSGHGSCGANDKCTCYRNWQGVGCNERVCPFAHAWSGFDTGEHPYLECAGRGVCDRATGLCTCDTGFEGKGCARMSCPNDCSNHGTCEYLDEINGALTSWDAHKIQMCNCDPGYSGYDCSERICPQGDDPITTSGTPVVYNFQTDATPAGDITLKYTDWRGNVFETNAIDLATITANVIQEALLALPNQAVTSVTVSGTDPSDGSGFDITFNSPTSGVSTGLTAQSVVCAVHGCQPKVSTASTNTLTLGVSSAQTIEFATCSNRGSCDTTTGLCLCESGYFGEACEGQTIIM